MGEERFVERGEDFVGLVDGGDVVPLDATVSLTGLAHFARFAVAGHALEEYVEGFALIVRRATGREEEDHLLTT